MNNPDSKNSLANMFRPKGQMTLENLLSQSVIGPIGVPAAEALYPPVEGKAAGPLAGCSSEHFVPENSVHSCAASRSPLQHGRGTGYGDAPVAPHMYEIEGP